jgi:syntaxin-binding protein 5
MFQHSTDRHIRVRLIAIRTSGLANIFTLTPPDSNSSWVVSRDRISVEAPASPIPGASFVLDGKTGARLVADPPHLALCLSTNLVTETRGMWVVAGAKGARCSADVDGARLGKAEWGVQYGTVIFAEIVERNGEIFPSCGD